MTTQEHIQAIRDHLDELEAELSDDSFEIKQVSDTAVQVNFPDIENPEILYSKSTARTFKLSDYKEVKSGIEIGGLDLNKWYFQLLDGKTVLDEKSLTLKSQQGNSSNEIKPILFGFWDGEHAPEDVQNVYKVYWNNLNDYPGKRLIPMIAGFSGTMSESDIRKRLSNRAPAIDRVKDQVEFVLLNDEPFYKNIDTEQQELIIRCAKEEMGDFKYTFSYARGALRDQPNEDRRLPELDLAIVNSYPFYYNDYWPDMYITDYDAFADDLMETCNVLRESVKEIVVNGQSIYDDNKYRKPPLGSPEWYFDFAQSQPDIIGLMWFEWRDRSHWKGAESMPEFLENIKKVYNEMD